MEPRDIAIWVFAGLVAVAVLYAIWTVRGVALRYVMAMSLAAGAALLSTLLVASPVASWVTGHLRFEGPDGAADVHMFTFLGVNIAALVVGWALGCIVSGPLAGRDGRP